MLTTQLPTFFIEPHRRNNCTHATVSNRLVRPLALSLSGIFPKGVAYQFIRVAIDGKRASALLLTASRADAHGYV